MRRPTPESEREIMTAQFARGPFRGRSGGSSPHEPHAALLIDFDNVTMGIRSDLTKELKNLLNSDIIKGKVAVQRAYADWRRYPQYIVPLAESSVDLIFAPAYGSAKKNATDIRLAIDAVELVFTRPEIGTIILLSGDSDFSSLVLKLKEYGKYVIGVGIRESASDLLVQNCDEYYSYSALTGLTRAGDESVIISEDPWELVEMGLRQMIENDDVMRSDRLKQVLLEMDPNFDEKALGFQKFNKFLQEAANRGIISLRKLENGQYEVGPPAGEPGAEPGREGRELREARDARDRGRRGRRGRGRRDEEREPREEREQREEREEREEREPAAPAAAAATAGEAMAPATAAEPVSGPVSEPAPAAAARPAAAAEPAPRGRGGRREERAEPAAERPEPVRDGTRPAPAEAADAEQESREPAAPAGAGELAGAYDLLRRATSDLVRRAGGVARDSDVKRRMIELQPGWDETPLGFSKFSRFLRQAHDAQVVTLRRGETGNYDVVPGDADVPGAEEDRAPRRDRERDRGRGRGRDRQRDEVAERPGAAAAESPRPAERAAAATVESAEPAERPAAASTLTTAPAAGATQATAPAATAAPTAPVPAARPESQAPAAAAGAPAQGRGAQPSAFGFRRGSRGRPAPSGPPPLLEGQAAGVQRPAAPPQPAAEPAAPEPAVEPAAAVTGAGAGTAGAGKQPSGRGKKAAKAAARPAAESARPGREAAPKKAAQLEFGGSDGEAAAPPKKAGKAARPAATADEAPARKTPPRQPAKKAARKASPGSDSIDAAELGLPRAAGEIARYIATNYKGVGPKSVEALLERFGAGRIFDALQNRPDEVRSIMGTGRGDRLLQAWTADLAARRAGGDGKATDAADDHDGGETPTGNASGRTRRGGRRGRRGGRTAAK
jgi:uncharacterized protein (TIGR00288 family)